MFVRVKDVIFCFEKITTDDENYFNLLDYRIYNEEERLQLIYNGVYIRDDFVLIPQINRYDIAIDFLKIKNMKKILHKIEISDFDQMFHWFIEDNNLKDEWHNFEEIKLIEFAAKWFDQNQIKYTLK